MAAGLAAPLAAAGVEVMPVADAAVRACRIRVLATAGFAEQGEGGVVGQAEDLSEGQGARFGGEEEMLGHGAIVAAERRTN